MNICTIMNICTSNSPPSPSPKPLVTTLSKRSARLTTMKKTHLLIINLTLLFGFTELKAQTLLPKLQNLFGAENVVAVDSSTFKEYYKINVPQLIDHNDESKGTFSNRVLLGYNDSSRPVVMESGPYGFYRKQENPIYKTEIAELLEANQIIIEHRYFGKSIPDSKNLQYLTYEQTSADFHHVRQVLQSVFPEKWIATGHSKGGDAVLAYRFHFPNDVCATVVYGASLTLEAEDKRFNNFFAKKRKTTDGRKIRDLQVYLLKNKERLLPVFNHHIKEIERISEENFGEYDAEMMYDFNVLGLEFLFWQSYGNYENFRNDIIENENGLKEMGYKSILTTDNSEDKTIYLMDIGELNTKSKIHYYQAFSQGGYHGYNIKPFQKYLKHKNYSLSQFAGEKTVFDPSFRLAQKKWAETEMEHVLLVLADTDPWSIVCPIPFPKDKDNIRLVLENSTHSVQLKDFDKEIQQKAKQKLTEWLNKSSH